MMKQRPNSPRDYEMLSAYLDGQLSPREIAQLRAHLKEDPQMQKALEELRMTRTALHSLPRLRAPRNFTLTPQMVRQRQPARRQAYPVFGFASLVASLLLVFVLIFDWTGFVSTAQTNTVQATQMEYAVQTLVVEGLAQKEAERPAAEAPATEAPSLGAESSLAAEALAEAMPYPEPSPEALLKIAPSEPFTVTTTPEEMGDITLSMVITSTEELSATLEWGIGGGPPAITPTLEVSQAMIPTSTPEPGSMLDLLPAASETMPAPSDAAQMKLAPSETPLAPRAVQPSILETPSSEPARLPARSVFLAAEIALAALAVISALIFIFLYRKSS